MKERFGPELADHHQTSLGRCASSYSAVTEHCKKLSSAKKKGHLRYADRTAKVLGVGDNGSGTVSGMTVQDEPRAMPQTAATRSRFMITDILNGPSDGAVDLMRTSGRSPSPGPRDLSLHSNPVHDSDTDSSGHPDTSSVCSNGEYLSCSI